jgi:hypothetical protein
MSDLILKNVLPHYWFGDSANDYFGGSVAVSKDGNTALVGAHLKHDSKGAVYVLTRNNDDWSAIAMLTIDGGVKGDRFGCEVALSEDGDIALISAIGKDENKGAAYIFVRPDSDWTSTSDYTAILTASDGSSGDSFGGSIALSGDGNTVLIGARYKNTTKGAAYIFTKSGDSWTQVATLTASDPSTSGYFGISVALSVDGSTALIGCRSKASDSYGGVITAYLYTKSDDGWSVVIPLIANDEVVASLFTRSVALSNDGSTALIGCWGRTKCTGVAYVFTKPNSGWSVVTQTAVLTASSSTADVPFGNVVALSGDGISVLVGVHSKNDSSGVVCNFTKPDDGWTDTTVPTNIVRAANGKAIDRYSRSIAVNYDSSVVLIGAPGKNNDGNARSGSVYVTQFRRKHGAELLSSVPRFEGNRYYPTLCLYRS